MSLHELSNPYCIAGIIIFIIIIAINIYYNFFTENFVIEPVTKEMNMEFINNIKQELNLIRSNLIRSNLNILPTISNIEELQQMLSNKNINIIEAYPYLPLYTILMQDNQNIDKDAFNE
jgi:hypothetical protein